MVTLSRHNNKKRKSSWAFWALILVLSGLSMLLITESFTDAEPPHSNSLTNLNGVNLGKILKRTSGNGWTMWDKTSPIVTKWTEHKECRWTTFTATNGKTAKICTHHGDAVSRAVINRGRFADCDILTKQFADTHPNKKARIFIEVGANIGACTLQMLFTTDAPIIAFEPEPKNLFCLTNTIMRLDERYRERFILFPFALGDTEGESIINSQVGDYGNAVVGEVAKNRAEETFQTPIPIRIEPLDSVVSTSDEMISLMKLHAQGQECKIMDGMREMLQHTKAVHTEMSKKPLDKQGCSEEEYIKKLEDAGFEIRNLKKLILDQEQKGEMEVLALNKNLMADDQT